MIKVDLIPKYSAPFYREGVVYVKRGSFERKRGGWCWFCVVANGGTNDCKPLLFPSGNPVCVHGKNGYTTIKEYFAKAEWLGRTWKNNDSPAWRKI